MEMENPNRAWSFATYVLFATMSLGYMGSDLFGVPVTVGITGTVTDTTQIGNPPVVGIKVYGAAAGGGLALPGWTTDSNGIYDSDFGNPMSGNAALNANVPWSVSAKMLAPGGKTKVENLGAQPVKGQGLQIIYQSTTTYLYGKASGNVTLVGNSAYVSGANIGLQNFTATNKYYFPRGILGPTVFLSQTNIDPTYDFTPSGSGAGTITFTDTYDPSLSSSLFEGVINYLDGSSATDNGSSETIFDQPVTISPITVLGQDGQGNFIFPSSPVPFEIGNASSGVYLQGNIVNIYGSDGADGPLFGGFLQITGLGTGLNSQLISDYETLESQGAVFAVGFDPTFVTSTDDFTTSASQMGTVEISTALVPEPTSIGIVIIAGLGCLLRPRGIKLGRC
jgi:hypothetical protein